MSDFNLFEVKRRCKEAFNLTVGMGGQTDGRGDGTKISTLSVGWAFLMQVFLGIGSIKGLEEWMKTDPVAGKLLGTEDQSNDGSDTTLLDAANGWDLDRLGRWVQSVVLSLREMGHWTRRLVTDREVRVGALDGSCFGNHWMAVLCVLGKQITAPLDLEPYDKRGKELPAARRILKRFMDHNGFGLTHCLVDGLYSVKDFFRDLPDTGVDWLVKTSEESLAPVRWAKEVFDACGTVNDLRDYGVELVEACDWKRRVQYRVWLVKQVPWDDLNRTLSVARVQLTFHTGPRSGRTETFWVLCTDESLSAVELREMALWRWGIENNLFRELNQRVGSKDAYIDNDATKHTLLWLWMLGWALFQWVRLEFDEVIQRLAETVRVTKRWLSMILRARSYQVLVDD